MVTRSPEEPESSARSQPPPKPENRGQSDLLVNPILAQSGRGRGRALGVIRFVVIAIIITVLIAAGVYFATR
jgi:hypothetical protein